MINVFFRAVIFGLGVELGREIYRGIKKLKAGAMGETPQPDVTPPDKSADEKSNEGARTEGETVVDEARGQEESTAVIDDAGAELDSGQTDAITDDETPSDGEKQKHEKSGERAEKEDSAELINEKTDEDEGSPDA